MAFPPQFISPSNFQLAFTRIVRGQNQEYKRFYRHLYPSFNLALADNLHDIIDDIKRQTYKPGPGTLIFQPKQSGILRPLRLLSFRDLLVYQAITNTIANSFKRIQDKFAYKKSFGAVFAGKESPFFYMRWKSSYRKYNRSIKRAFRGGHNYVADFDLVSFYELIDHKLLQDVLKKQIKNQDLLDLLFECLGYWSSNEKGAHLAHGIPQGPEPSAFLAECFLFHFDAIRFKKVHYCRYVDDIKLMAKDETPVRRALLKLDIESKNLGLVPQAQKIELRYVTKLDLLLKTIPSNILSVEKVSPASARNQRRLLRLFRQSVQKKGKHWVIRDSTKFKFALVRMNPRKDVLRVVALFLPRRPDLSGMFSSFLRKFPQNKPAADYLLSALKMDPTYDASAADYIYALDICEPPLKHRAYRRAVQTVEQRSEEKGLHLKIAAATFRGKRRGAAGAIRLIEKQENPIAKGILLYRLFGNTVEAPHKLHDCVSLLQRGVCDRNEDLARFSASLLLELWPLHKTGSLFPKTGIHHCVKILQKALGLRKRTPRKLGILDVFFRDRMKIGVPIAWTKALRKNRRDVEARCLRLQKLEIGDPSAYVLMLDTFNEALIQDFSAKHPGLCAAYRSAAGSKLHPDLGNWLSNPAISAILRKYGRWFQEVHGARVKADLAHAKTKKGERTRPISYWKRDRLQKGAQLAWAELIIEWSKCL